MPYKIKVASQKRRLKEPSDFLSIYEKGLDFIRENSRLFTSIGGFLLLVTIGAGIFWFYNYNMNKQAFLLDYNAERYLTEESKLPSDDEKKTEQDETGYVKAIELYQKILHNYPGSISAPVAQYQLGNIYFEQGEYDKAIEAFKEFIKRYRDNKELLSLIYQKLGYVYMKKKDYPDAMGAFKEVVSMDDIYNKGQSYYELGYINEVLGNNDEAIAMYEMVMKDSPTSPLATESEMRLNKLKPVSETISEDSDKPKPEDSSKDKR
ncbi:MAG: tetratricopeptide repeat protein [Nitrospirota bacterium]